MPPYLRQGIRCLQTKRFGYIFNAWSDGTKTYRAEPMTGLTFPAMERAAPADKYIAARVEMLLHRVLEELYDFQADPEGLHNLIAEPKHQGEVRQMRKAMLAWMKSTKDPLLESYQARVNTAP